MPSVVPSGGWVRADAGDGVAGGARLVAEQRRRGVEAERLRDGVRRRCGWRRRRARAACRSRCRARSRPCARGSSRRAAASRPAAARGTAPRRRARRARSRSGRPAPCATPIDRRERVLRAPGDQQHRRQERRREQRRDGRRRLRVGVGEPVVHRRPADLGGESREQRAGRRRAPSPARRRRSGARARRARRGRRPGLRRRACTIPSSAMPSPSEVRIRYFQPASSARALPLKPTSSADAAVVASISSHAAPRLPASGTASRTAQKANSTTKYVRCRAPAGDERRPDRGRGTPARRARWRVRRRAMTPSRSPPAASTAIRLPTNVVAGIRERERRQRQRERGGRERAGDRDARHEPAGRDARVTAAVSAGAASTAQASVSRLVTQAPQRRAVAGAELGEDPLVEDGRDERDERQVERDAELDQR